MNVCTIEQAEKLWCVQVNAPCRAYKCMAWRWQELMTDDNWIEAVKKAAFEMDDKTPSRAKAAAHVNKNRALYGLPDRPYRGYCGLAGKP